MCTQKAINIENVTNYMKSHTNKQGAEYFGLSLRTFIRFLAKNNLRYYYLKYKDYPKNLSPLQNDVFLGTMLGDATIMKDGRYKFKQCIRNLEYVEHIHDVFNPFSRRITLDKTRKPSNTNGKVIDLSTWNGEWLYSKYFVTIRTPFFKTERKRWYVGSKKIIPNDFNVLNPRIIAYWYQDDGSNKSKGKECTLHTNGFSSIEVDNLRGMLKIFNIKSTRQMRENNPIIAISRTSYFDFIDLVKPYINLECMKYKVDITNAPNKLMSYRLGLNKAEEIRLLYNSDKYTQKQLSNKYNISVGTVWKIINDKIYKQGSQHLSGAADVQVTYKVESCLSEIKMGRFLSQDYQTM